MKNTESIKQRFERGVDLLSKSGIKPHGYNVVMQGDVTRIMEMSDFERRKIIDEIAGVAEFDQKKEQSLRELELGLKWKVGRLLSTIFTNLRYLVGSLNRRALLKISC
jgi:chromosome segregation ATPase